LVPSGAYRTKWKPTANFNPNVCLNIPDPQLLKPIRLPTEILHKILTECSQQDRARMVQTSSVFRTISTPFLFHDITLGDLEKEKMFREVLQSNDRLRRSIKRLCLWGWSEWQEWIVGCSEIPVMDLLHTLVVGGASTPLDEFLKVVGQVAPNVQSLSVAHVQRSFEVSTSGVTLPSLRQLRFQSCSELFEGLDGFTPSFPLLETVEIGLTPLMGEEYDLDGSPELDVVFGFLSSLPRLQNLLLYGPMNIGMGMFDQSIFPTLRILVISPWPCWLPPLPCFPMLCQLEVGVKSQEDVRGVVHAFPPHCLPMLSLFEVVVLTEYHFDQDHITLDEVEMGLRNGGFCFEYVEEDGACRKWIGRRGDYVGRYWGNGLGDFFEW